MRTPTSRPNQGSINQGPEIPSARNDVPDGPGPINNGTYLTEALVGNPEVRVNTVLGQGHNGTNLPVTLRGYSSIGSNPGQIRSRNQTNLIGDLVGNPELGLRHYPTVTPGVNPGPGQLLSGRTEVGVDPGQRRVHYRTNRTADLQGGTDIGGQQGSG